jgi:hypothetical protein
VPSLTFKYNHVPNYDLKHGVHYTYSLSISNNIMLELYLLYITFRHVAVLYSSGDQVTLGLYRQAFTTYIYICRNISGYNWVRTKGLLNIGLPL